MQLSVKNECHRIFVFSKAQTRWDIPPPLHEPKNVLLSKTNRFLGPKHARATTK